MLIENIFLLIVIYMLWRNEKVCEFRNNLLYENYDDYLKLPGYNDMLFKYRYILNFEKFKEMN